MELNFDNEENIKTAKTPVKVLNDVVNYGSRISVQKCASREMMINILLLMISMSFRET